MVRVVVVQPCHSRVLCVFGAAVLEVQDTHVRCILI